MIIINSRLLLQEINFELFVKNKLDSFIFIFFLVITDLFKHRFTWYFDATCQNYVTYLVYNADKLISFSEVNHNSQSLADITNIGTFLFYYDILATTI